MTIEECRAAISFESANGGEFGKSEVIVLAAKSSDPDRSVEFLSTLTQEIDVKLAEIRANRFQSMESELQATCDSALRTRAELENKIKEMDAAFGTNISLVQGMNERTGGNPSAFDNKLNQIRSDRRNAVREKSALSAFKTWLRNADQGPAFELPTSTELLASQPALSELVTGLAEAKGELSEAEGQFQAAHPMVKKGRAKVASMKRQIAAAIPSTINGLDGQIAVLEDRIALLDNMMSENASLLRDISAQRVPYAALTRELEKQTESASDARSRLAQVKSRKDASSSIQLLTRIGEPWVGTRADGLGKRMLALAGGIAGLIIGLGLVMICAPPFVDPSQDSATVSLLPDSGSDQSEPPFDGDGSHRPFAHQSQESSPTPVEVPVEPAPVAMAPAPAMAPVALPPSSDAQASIPVVQAPTAPVAPAPEPAAVAPEPTSVAQASFPVVQTAPPVEAPETSPSASFPIVETPPPAVAPESFVQTPPMAPVTEPVIQVAAPFDQEPVQEVSSTATASSASEAVFVAGAAGIAGVAAAAASGIGEVVPMPEELESVVDSVIPQSPSLDSLPAELPPIPKPASKTLASIFANMPQPKIDVTEDQVPATDLETPVENVEASKMIDDKIDALSEELRNTDPIPAPETMDRISAETIQLGDNKILAEDAIPLQRRTSLVRPVDLERVDENANDSVEVVAMTRENLDSAFSDLEPTQSETRSNTDSQSLQSEIEDLFQDDA